MNHQILKSDFFVSATWRKICYFIEKISLTNNQIESHFNNKKS